MPSFCVNFVKHFSLTHPKCDTAERVLRADITYLNQRDKIKQKTGQIHIERRPVRTCIGFSKAVLDFI